jgi:hypothetical protein
VLDRHGDGRGRARVGLTADGRNAARVSFHFGDAWITLSSVTFSLTTSFPFRIFLSPALSATTVGLAKLTYRFGP